MCMVFWWLHSTPHRNFQSLPESYTHYADRFANFQLMWASNLTKNMEEPGAFNKVLVWGLGFVQNWISKRLFLCKGTHRNTCTPKMKTWFNRTLLRQSAKFHAGLIAHSLDASFCLLSQIIGAKVPLSPGLRAASTLCTRNLVNHPKQFVIQTNYRKIET